MIEKKSFEFAVNPYRLISGFAGTVAWLNSNDDQTPGILAMGVYRELKVKDETGAFDRLADFYTQHEEWLFGYLTYDLKNELEKLESKNKDLVGFPALYFFKPQFVFSLHSNRTELILIDPEVSISTCEKMAKMARGKWSSPGLPVLESKVKYPSKHDYLNHYQRLEDHIQRGDTYEINYCIPFSVNKVVLDPLALYHRFNEMTKAPFSVFFRSKEYVLISGSPERYLKKEGDRLISQPIKGTMPRGQTKKEDDKIKSRLKNDPKERAENVMIVDLVRNDLSKVAAPESVKVDELCKVYSFRTVHQLVSTVSCRLDPLHDPIEAIKATFPMGSMTGAPKVRTMQLIEHHESFKRGLYSGAFGCFLPNGDFDFNVIIRSFLYNTKMQRIAFPVGGAITSQTDGQREYKECLLKAEAMLKAIQND